MKKEIKVLLLILTVVIGCQKNSNIPQERQPALISLEMRFTNIFVHDKSDRTFKALWNTADFVKKITGRDSLAVIDSLLSSIDGKSEKHSKELLGGMIAQYSDGKQDTIVFTYGGISYREQWYGYASNKEFVYTIASHLPDINRYFMQLTINPDDSLLKKQLHEALLEHVENVRLKEQDNSKEGNRKSP